MQSFDSFLLVSTIVDFTKKNFPKNYNHEAANYQAKMVKLDL